MIVFVEKKTKGKTIDAMKRAFCVSREEEEKKEKEKNIVDDARRVLPDLVVRKIFEFIDRPLLLTAAQVSLRWKVCAFDEFFSSHESTTAVQAEVERNDLRLLWFQHDADVSVNDQSALITLARHRYVHSLLARVESLGSRVLSADQSKCQTVVRCLWKLKDPRSAVQYLRGLLKHNLLDVVFSAIQVICVQTVHVDVIRWLWENHAHQHYSRVNTTSINRELVVSFMEFGYLVGDASVLDVMQIHHVSTTTTTTTSTSRDVLKEQNQFLMAAVKSGDVAMLDRFMAHKPAECSMRMILQIYCGALDDDWISDFVSQVAALGKLDALRWVVEKCEFHPEELELDGGDIFVRACESRDPNVAQWLHANYPSLCDELTVDAALDRACHLSSVEMIQWLVATFSITRQRVVSVVRKLLSALSDVVRYLYDTYALTTPELGPLLVSALGCVSSYENDDSTRTPRALYDLAVQLRVERHALQRALLRAAYLLMLRRNIVGVDWIFSVVGLLPEALVASVESWFIDTYKPQRINTLKQYSWKPTDNVQQDILWEMRRRCTEKQGLIE
jgi:hypothetical protein